MSTFSINLPVRFAETDAMGVVHHSNYVVWFEAARVALMEMAGIPYAEVAAGGHHFAVTNVQVEYRAPARFGNTIRVDVNLELLRSRQVKFRYQVFNLQNGNLLANGSTEHICVDLDGRMAKIPEHVITTLQKALA